MNDLNIISSHRSVRKFLKKEIHQDVLNNILTASQWASTSNHLQAYSVIVVKNEQKKETLSELCGSQKHVKECPVFLVFCADLNRIKISHELEEKPNHLDTVEPFIVATVDASIYGQNVLLASELLGLGGVFIGGIRNQPEKVSQLLKIPEYVYPVFGMCIGYPDSEHLNEQKPRLPSKAIVHEETYDNIKQTDIILNYNKQMKTYYEKRSSSRRSQTWSSYVTEVYNQPSRPHIKDFLERKKFGFK